MNGLFTAMTVWIVLTVIDKSQKATEAATIICIDWFATAINHAIA